MAQLVKNPPAMRETWVQSQGLDDPLEKGKATHSSTLAWRIPFRYDLNQIPYDYTVEVRNRFKGLDLIDRVPEECHGLYSPWGCKESDTTEQLSLSLSLVAQ